jgi:hypothetical protein
MEQSRSWEANRFAASQEMPHIFMEPENFYRTNKSLSWANSTQCPHPLQLPEVPS